MSKTTDAFCKVSRASALVRGDSSVMAEPGAPCRRPCSRRAASCRAVKAHSGRQQRRTSKAKFQTELSRAKQADNSWVWLQI